MSAPGTHGGPGGGAPGEHKPEQIFIREDATTLEPLPSIDEPSVQKIFDEQIEEEAKGEAVNAETKLTADTTLIPFGSAKKKKQYKNLDETKSEEKTAKEKAKAAKVKELGEKKLLDAAAAKLSAGASTGDILKKAKELAADECARQEYNAARAIFRGIDRLLDDPKANEEDIKKLLMGMAKKPSLRGIHAKEDLKNLLFENLGGRHRAKLEKLFANDHGLLDAWGGSLGLATGRELAGIQSLDLRGKVGAHVRRGLVAASTAAAEATPAELVAATEHAEKYARRVGKVLDAIARKDAEAGSFASGEITSKDFWRLKGRGILSFLNAHPKTKGLLKFGGYTLIGAGGLTIVGGIIIGAISAALLAGAGVIGAGVFGQVFSGGWKKPAGGGGGGGHGGGH